MTYSVDNTNLDIVDNLYVEVKSTATLETKYSYNIVVTGQGVLE